MVIMHVIVKPLGEWYIISSEATDWAAHTDPKTVSCYNASNTVQRQYNVYYNGLCNNIGVYILGQPLLTPNYLSAGPTQYC